jgi:hypothetical protein
MEAGKEQNEIAILPLFILPAASSPTRAAAVRYWLQDPGVEGVYIPLSHGSLVFF